MTYTVRWVPIGPEISVNCRDMREAIALANELVAMGKTETIRLHKDGRDITQEVASQAEIAKDEFGMALAFLLRSKTMDS